MKSSKLQGSIFKIKILAFAGILLLIWCGYRLIKTGLEEQQDYEFLAVSEEQEKIGRASCRERVFRAV